MRLNDEALEVLEKQRGKHSRWVFPFRGHAMENPAQDAYKARGKGRRVTGGIRLALVAPRLGELCDGVALRPLGAFALGCVC